MHGQPALRRFMGNPYTLSPKARVRSWLGLGFPFDRHDWYVDRGGASVHYVIDYFYNPAGPAVAAPAPGAPPAYPLTGSIHVDVRPAVESPGAALDRLRLFPARALAALRRPRFVAEGIDPSLADPAAVAEAARHVGDSNAAAAALAAAPAAPPAVKRAPPPPPTAEEAAWAAMDLQCAPLLHALKSSNDAERPARHVALNYCMGRALCPREADAFLAALEAGKAPGAADAAAAQEEKAFGAMTRCVMRAGAARRPAGAAAPAAALQ